MNPKHVLWMLGAVALLAGCEQRTGLDPVGVYPEPELSPAPAAGLVPGPRTGVLGGNEPGLDPIIQPGVDTVDPLP